MKVLALPKITYKQKEILDLLYTHRFLTRIQIQALLKHKDKKTINLWLKNLREKDYINWIYDKDHFAEKTKPAIYYLGSNAIRRLLEQDFHSRDDIRKRYKEHERSQDFIDRCLLITECCISLEKTRDENGYPSTYYFYETEADYASDSYFHFLTDSELIHPQLCFQKLRYDGGSAEPRAVESFLLEVFDATLPRYRLQYRLKQYVTYMDEELGVWDDETYGDPPHVILLVCATLADLIYAKRSIRGLLADRWERGEEGRPDIRFATAEKLKERGVLVEEIWEKV